MKHLRQPNGWSCMATSFAMVLDTTVDEVFRYTGHDGSAIVFPSLKDPHNRRGHTIYEMIQFSLDQGYAITPFQHKYAHECLYSDERIEVLLNPKTADELFEQADMVLIGTMWNGAGHAAAWDSIEKKVLDPNGVVYRLENYPMNVEMMLLCLPLRQHLSLSLMQEPILQTNASTS